MFDGDYVVSILFVFIQVFTPLPNVKSNQREVDDF